MRIRLIVHGAALAATVSPMVGQTPRKLSATLELTVPGRPFKLEAGNAWVTVGTGGTIAIRISGETTIQLVGADGKAIKKLGDVGDEPGKVRNVAQTGWVGDSLWVVDHSLGRVTVFTPEGKLGRIEAVPLTIQGPPGTLPRVHPATFVPLVQRIYPGGNLLVSETFPLPGQVTIAAGYRVFALQVSGIGGYAAVAGAFLYGSEQCAFPFPAANFIVYQPFCLSPRTEFSVDGRSVVNVRGSVTGPDSGRVRVVRTNEGGDTLLARSFVVAMAVVTAREADSAIAALVTQYRTNPRANAAFLHSMDSTLRSAPTKVHQPVRRLLASNDGTVWIELFSPTSGHQWMIIDGKGEMVGLVTLPEEVHIDQAEGLMAWGVKRLPGGGADVVRYRVGTVN